MRYPLGFWTPCQFCFHLLFHISIIGRYSPNAFRSAVLISPVVAFALTASIIGYIRFLLLSLFLEASISSFESAFRTRVLSLVSLNLLRPFICNATDFWDME